MNNAKRLSCFIVVVLGFTFFPGLAESKGATFHAPQYVLFALSVL
jgi:hypothetical protein